MLRTLAAQAIDSWKLGKSLKKGISVESRGRFHKLIYALRPAICTLRPTFEKLFAGAKVQRKVHKISVERNTVYEIDPRLVWGDVNCLSWEIRATIKKGHGDRH